MAEFLPIVPNKEKKKKEEENRIFKFFSLSFSTWISVSNHYFILKKSIFQWILEVSYDNSETISSLFP